MNADAPWVTVYRLRDDGRFQKPDYRRACDSVVSEVLSGERIALAPHSAISTAGPPKTGPLAEQLWRGFLPDSHTLERE